MRRSEALSSGGVGRWPMGTALTMRVLSTTSPSVLAPRPVWGPRGAVLLSLAAWCLLAACTNQGQAWQRTLQEGRASLAEGNVQEAEALFLTALDRAEQFGRDDPRVAVVLNDLARLYYDQGDFVEAEPLYQRMLEIWEETYGPDSLHVAATLNNLGVLHRMHGQYSEAEPYLTRALTIKEQRLGPDDPEVAFTLRNLATLYDTQGKYGKAEPLYRRVLEIRSEEMGPSHPKVADALEDYAAVLKALDRPTEAAQLLARAEKIRASADVQESAQ